VCRDYKFRFGFGIDWPPASPDFNVLDYSINPLLKKAAFENRRPGSLKDLKEKVSKILNGWDRDLLLKSINRISRRVHQCLEQGGGAFEYLN